MSQDLPPSIALFRLATGYYVSCAIHAVIETASGRRLRGGGAGKHARPSRGRAARLGANDLDPSGAKSVVVASRREMLVRYGLCRVGVGKVVFRPLLRAL